MSRQGLQIDMLSSKLDFKKVESSMNIQLS